MANYSDFKREEEPKLEGKRRCVITKVEEKVSSSGNDMIVIYLRPSGCKFELRYWAVHNDSFNRKMTAFFDSFAEIPFGSFENMEVAWVGAEGIINIGRDKNDYLEVKGFVDAVSGRNLPPYEGERPPRQQITSLEDETENSDDLPF